MTRTRICDVCGSECSYHRGKLWATFKRKYRHRIMKWGRRNNPQRYDFCNDCWNGIVEEITS